MKQQRSSSRRLFPGRKEQENDLGLGTKIGASGERLISKDGRFNVRRNGRRQWLIYEPLIEMSWVRFLLLVVVFYFAINAVFAVLLASLGPGALIGVDEIHFTQRLLKAFFFSMQTFTTVGYGAISPHSIAANFVAVTDAMVGLIAVALVTGLVFSRFSRPKAHILFSQNALIAPYKEGRSLQFRIVNERSNKIINLEMQVVFSWTEQHSGEATRRYIGLKLEREKVTLFPLNWTLVHAIDEDSPFNNLTPERLHHMNAEILVIVQGFDETFSQTVHANNSYMADEVLWDYQFNKMYFSEGGVVRLELDKLDDVAKV
ncbi:MAG: ion channel [Saprospiraceae bacterium]|nr:ion channel [Saprospiraceae bacterium]